MHWLNGADIIMHRWIWMHDMLLEEMMRDERREGVQEGMQKGQERINKLIILLSKQNRNEDIIKAATDREYQEKLLKEFNL